MALYYKMIQLIKENRLDAETDGLLR